MPSVEFDKFYTQKNVAKQCYDFLVKIYPNAKEEVFLEPSAGSGVFLDFLPKFLALDIKPEGKNITQCDFLDFVSEKKDYITIGNPPFGNRSDLAIKFFNKAAEISDIIAFIVPVSFMKWNVQKQLNKDFALVNYFYLEPESFLANNTPFSVRTVFQVWVKKNGKYSIAKDKRLLSSPPISHEDFKIWQYNATPGALKTVEEDWSIATYRQGYYDYNKIFNREDYNFIKAKMTDPAGKQQFFFIKPLTEEAEQIIYNMDFNALAERNTSTPGFGKGDFVNYYMELKDNI